jgi:hypothetical protein
MIELQSAARVLKRSTRFSTAIAGSWCLLAAVVGTSACIPKGAGDPCTLDDDDCPSAFVCEAITETDARCHVRVGGTCDALESGDAFCAAGTECRDDPAGGPGDAVCGGVSSACPQAQCAASLVCREQDDGRRCRLE